MVTPSNMLAAVDNPGKHVFPNLARHIPEDATPERRKAIFDEVDTTIRGELIAAGILNLDGTGDPRNYMEDEFIRLVGGHQHTYKEVPCAIFASKFRWKFERRWYYYAATGPGIPPEKAEEFHKTWGKQVRVDGHCGCPSPLEWEHGFAVGSYHIDTQEGLNAFVELLRSIYIPNEVDSPDPTRSVAPADYPSKPKRW